MIVFCCWCFPTKSSDIMESVHPQSQTHFQEFCSSLWVGAEVPVNMSRLHLGMSAVEGACQCEAWLHVNIAITLNEQKAFCMPVVHEKRDKLKARGQAEEHHTTLPTVCLRPSPELLKSPSVRTTTQHVHHFTSHHFKSKPWTLSSSAANTRCDWGWIIRSNTMSLLRKKYESITFSEETFLLAEVLNRFHQFLKWPRKDGWAPKSKQWTTLKTKDWREP